MHFGVEGVPFGGYMFRGLGDFLGADLSGDSL